MDWIIENWFFILVALLCLGSFAVGQALARELVKTFLKAKYCDTKYFQRRLRKAAVLE